MMKRIKQIVVKYFLIALSLIFLFSCALFDQQTKKGAEDKVPESKALPEKEQKKAEPKEKEKEKPREVHRETHKEIKPPQQHAPAKSGEIEHKEDAVAPAKKPTTLSSQQKYYNMGMNYYSQEKYSEAKEAWEKVVKLGKRTALAAKARENIKKVQQILKTLEEIGAK